MSAKRSKFGAIATYVCKACGLWDVQGKCGSCKGTEFIRFDSKAEARRYGTLSLLQKGGLIRDLTLQPEFPVTVNGVQVFKYVADFSYHRAGRWVVEDVKGVQTDMFKLKRKCVKAQYGIDVDVVAA